MRRLVWERGGWLSRISRPSTHKVALGGLKKSAGGGGTRVRRRRRRRNSDVTGRYLSARLVDGSRSRSMHQSELSRGIVMRGGWTKGAVMWDGRGSASGSGLHRSFGSDKSETCWSSCIQERVARQ